MIDPRQFRMRVVRPALKHLHPLVPYSLAAENLLLGTAIVESRLTYLYQVPSGPARGLFQIEPATHRDVWENWLAFKPELASMVRSFAGQRWPGTLHDPGIHEELETNLTYATAIARLVYRRSKASLPGENDAPGLAKMHKLVYNTVHGATRVEESVGWFEQVVAGGRYAAPAG